MAMDSARFNRGASMEHDTSRSHSTELLNKSVTHEGRPPAVHMMPSAGTTQRVRELREAINSNGAGTVALPLPGAIEITPADEVYTRRHGLLARSVKRAFDLVGALLLIAILSPALLVIAFLIKNDTPGPILFRQRRIGRDGRGFWMLKFRTMIDGADDHKHKLRHLNQAADGLFKINGDPRITRVGNWLRATSLDELPQLLHVVTGKMSLVGPRPLVPDEDEQITGANRTRLQMRPGMTGVWQVGGASQIPIAEMVELDRRYVEDWSLWLDLRLLAQTAAHVFLRRGL
jgi:lipopolysaccharide/colanic/teichoic acid biosynthesis glycosyltransferase